MSGLEVVAAVRFTESSEFYHDIKCSLFLATSVAPLLDIKVRSFHLPVSKH